MNQEIQPEDVKMDNYLEWLHGIYTGLSEVHELPKLYSKLESLDEKINKLEEMEKSDSNAKPKAPKEKVLRDIEDVKGRISYLESFFKYLAEVNGMERKNEMHTYRYFKKLPFSNQELINFKFPKKEIDVLFNEIDVSFKSLVDKLNNRFINHPLKAEVFLQKEIDAYKNKKLTTLEKIKNKEFIDSISSRNWEFFFTAIDLKYINYLDDLLLTPEKLESFRGDPFSSSNYEPMRWNASTKALGTIFGTLIKEGFILDSSGRNTSRCLAEIFANVNATTLNNPVSFSAGTFDNKLYLKLKEALNEVQKDTE